jgi:hypothetical protein
MQVPIAEHLLWGIVCFNIVLMVIISLRWRPLLKQRNGTKKEDQVVVDRPRLPEPITSSL